MSAGFGKAILPNTSDGKIRQHGRNIAELYSMINRRSQSYSVARPIGGTGNNAQEVVNRLNVRGGSMLGRLAFHSPGSGNDVSVASNIDVGISSGFYNSYVRLGVNLGGTINFILGAANEGDFLMIQGGSGYTFFSQSGNILLPANSPNPFCLQGQDVVTFIYDASRTKWVMQSTPLGSLAFVQFGSPDGTDPTTIFKSAVSYPVIRKGNGSYTVDSQNGPGTDYFIVMIDPNFARNVTLPDATLYKGRIITVKHGGTLFNVNVLPQSGQAIDGASSYVINTIYGSITVFSDGFNWFIISKVT